MEHNTWKLIKLAEEATQLGYGYADFCEEVAAWAKENDEEWDGGYSPSNNAVAHAKRKLAVIKGWNTRKQRKIKNESGIK